MRGSSALRTALWRAMRNEAVTELGLPALQLCWDLEKLYDTLAPTKVVAKNIELGYPALQMLLGMLVHTAGRVLSAEGLLSQAMFAQISIIAGCMQSTSWAKGILYNLLDGATRRFRPATRELGR